MVKEMRYLAELNEAIDADDVTRLADLWTTVLRKRTPPFSNSAEYAEKLAKEYRCLVITACQSNSRTTGGHAHSLIYLVNQGFPVNFSDGRTTPLHACLDCGYEAGVRFLLRNNADVDARASPSDARTALHAAVSQADCVSTRLLLAKGARVDVACELRRTPLEVAALYGHRELCGELLRHDARIIPAGVGGSALHTAAREGNLSVLKLFAGHVDLDTPEEPSLRRSLHEAAARGQLETVEFLLGRGVNAASTDHEDRTPLHATIQSRHDPSSQRPKDDFTAIAALLLKSAPHLVSARDSAGDTPLHLSTRNGFYRIAEMLLVNGADGSSPAGPAANLSGRTALDECVPRDTAMRQLFTKYAALSSAYLKLGQVVATSRDDDVGYAKAVPSAPPLDRQQKKRMAPVVVQ